MSTPQMPSDSSEFTEEDKLILFFALQQAANEFRRMDNEQKHQEKTRASTLESQPR